MRQIIFSISIFLLFTISAFSQNYVTSKTATGKLKKIYERGLQLSFNSHLEGALVDMEKALEIAPNFIDAQMAWANIKYDLGDLEAAEKGFEKVLVIDPNYAYNVPYNLGLIEWKLNKFGEAAEHFQQFLDGNPRSKRRIEPAKVYLRNSKFAAEAVKNPVPFEPINLGNNVNTKSQEYFPSLTADSKTLVYTAVVNGQEDFYQSINYEGKWGIGEPIKGVNTPMNEGAQSISVDGKFLVFTACERREGMGGCELYFAEVKNGQWTKQQNMGAPVNTPARETQPSISADGKTLFFASNRKGSLGKMDLWISNRRPNGRWSVPQNLGETINTKGEEKTPFIHPDGQSLYFMSDGHPGMGGMDMFVSRKQPDGTWGTPENLGYPLNTKKDEGFLVISVDGKTAFFSSDRKDFKDAQGGMDIYSFELPEAARPQPVTYVRAIIKDEETRRKVAAKVEIIDIQSGDILTTTNVGDDGEFLMTLPVGKDYMLNASKENYLFHSENFALTKEYDLEKPFLLKINLVPIAESISSTGDTPPPNSKPIILKNVFFETGSAELLSTSLLELNRLKTLLNEHPNLKIQINGHTDNVGTETDNLTLSSNRAKAVQDWLIENDVEANRLKFKGFGEKESIATNTSEEGRKENRRVEFMVVE